MPTPIFQCCAGCGISVVGTVSAGVEHWSAVTGSPSIASSPGAMALISPKAHRFNTAAATCRLTHAYAAAVGSPATVVLRCYIYFTTLPNANSFLFGAVSPASNFGGVTFNSGDNTLRAGSVAGGGTGGAVVTTGVLYRLDVKVNFGSAGNLVVDLSVNGVAQTQHTTGLAATTADRVVIGHGGVALTGDYYVTGVIVSGTAGDFPIGAGAAIALYPSGDGAHGGGWAAGTFGKGTSGGTNANNSDTDLWTNLDNPLVATAAGTWLADLTGVALTDYIELLMADPPIEAFTINGVLFVATTHSATTTANNLSVRLTDAGGAGPAELINVVDLSETAITIPVVQRNTDAGGNAWTPERLNAARLRFSSTDSNPDVYLDGVCMEVDYVPAAGAIPVLVDRGRRMRRSQALHVRGGF